MNKKNREGTDENAFHQQMINLCETVVVCMSLSCV